MTIGQRRAK